MKKFLVSARNDRGGVSIGEERLNAILKNSISTVTSRPAPRRAGR